MSTQSIPETVKEVKPWGFNHRLIPVYKNGNQFTVFGKSVETVGQAKAKIDNAYLSLSKSIK